MLVCDHCHTKVCHIYCLTPPIVEIPFEPWYCDFCIRDHGIRSSLPTAGLFEAQGPRRRLRREAAALETGRQAFASEDSDRHSSSSLINTHLSRRQTAQQRAGGRRAEARPGRGRRPIRRDSQSSSRSPSPAPVNSNTFVFSANQLQSRQDYRTRTTQTQRRARATHTLNSRHYQPRQGGPQDSPENSRTRHNHSTSDLVTDFRRARSIFGGTQHRLSREEVDFPARLREASFSEEFAAGPVGPRSLASGHW